MPEAEVDLDASLKINIETIVNDAQTMDNRVGVSSKIELESLMSKVNLDANLKINPETIIDDTQTMDDSIEVDSKPKHRPYMQINTFRLRLLKVGATIARHSRYVTFSIALSAEQLWICFLDHFQRLRWHSLSDI